MEEQLRQECVVNIANKEHDGDQLAESEITDKQNKRSCIKNLSKCFDTYKLSSKEVREKKRSPIEKIVWSLMFTFFLLYCGCLIWKSYMKWSKSPAIVILSENSKPVWKIPFPAVTICPTRKVKSEVFSLERFFESITDGNETEIERSVFEDVSLICGTYYELRSDLSAYYFMLDKINKEKLFSYDNETVDNIKKVSTTLSDVMFKCYWEGGRTPCDKIFSPILTDEGVCFTFNTIGPEDLFRNDNLNTDYEYSENLERTRIQNWTPEDGYALNYSVKTYPKRSTGTSVRTGLKVILTEKEETLDPFCMSMVTGFKILLHDPSTLPRFTQDYIRVPSNEEVTVIFAPKMVTTSEGLKEFSSTRSQCYFANERWLKYFNIYTQSNCESECLANFTYARCDCVPFSKPHGPDMKVCSAGKLNCTQNAELELSTVEIGYKLNECDGNTTSEEAYKIARNCNCLPACTSITYQTETSQLKLQEKRRLFGSKYNSSETNASVLVVFFKNSLFDISKRAELYSTTDIIASWGGILGLFMGFSVINIIKTFYICIVRMCRQRRDKSKKLPHTKEQAVQNAEEKY